jgi:hypothetical protein
MQLLSKQLLLMQFQMLWKQHKIRRFDPDKKKLPADGVPRMDLGVEHLDEAQRN